MRAHSRTWSFAFSAANGATHNSIMLYWAAFVCVSFFLKSLSLLVVFEPNGKKLNFTCNSCWNEELLLRVLLCMCMMLCLEIST